jgi:hypothetical protein
VHGVMSQNHKRFWRGLLAAELGLLCDGSVTDLRII